MNQIAVFSAESAIVAFEDKKGNQHFLSAEATLFKGGAALRALKDVALQTAANKAANGRYRSAADIIGVAFPKVAKAYATFMNIEPHASASTFALFIDKCETDEGGKNGFTAKQNDAKDLMRALRTIPALAKPANSGEVIDA